MFQFTYHLIVRVHADTKAQADSAMDSFLKMLKELSVEEGTKYRLRSFQQTKEGYSFAYLLIVPLIEENSAASEKKVSEILASLQLNQSVTSASYRQHGEATSVGPVKRY